MFWRHWGNPEASKSRIIHPLTVRFLIVSETAFHFAAFVSLEILYLRQKLSSDLQSFMFHDSQYPKAAEITQDHFGIL